MATTADLTTTVQVAIRATKKLASDLSDGAPDTVNSTYSKSTTVGTTDNKADGLFHDQRTATAAADRLDFSSGLTDAQGVAIVWAKLRWIAIENTSTTTTESLSINAAGATQPITGISSVIPPGGIYIITGPVDGFTIDATHDSVTVNPGAATIIYNVWAAGTTA